MRCLQIAADRLGELVVGRAARGRARAGRARECRRGRCRAAVGRDPRARAVAAERLRHGRDHADLARAVAVAPALRDLAAVVRIDRLERVDSASIARDDLGGGDDVVEPPAVRVPDVHVLDEAERVAGVRGSGAPSSRIASSLTPRLTTAFTFTGSPAAAAASIPSSTRCTGKSTSFIARKASSSSESRLTVTRSQPGVRERLRLRREQRRVRRQRQLDVERRQPRDQPLERRAARAARRR